jgi:membrane protein implicated in regulation of membrane protease activity
MKEQIAKLIDLKSIITLTLIITLEIIVIMVFLNGNMDLIQIVFALFSNVLTMVITYFFTKKQTEKINQIKEGE